MSKGSYIRPLIIVIISLTIIRLLWAAFLPLMLDESYYLSWSNQIDWGYLDHPPFVAFSSLLNQWFPGSLSARFGSIIIGLLQTVLICNLFSIYFPKEKSPLRFLIFTSFSLANIAVFSLLIPDAGLVFFWTLAIHEASIAIIRDEKRWLTAGIATGLGILSKYTMVLIGPVFLISLIKEKKLSTKWPYLGALFCIITISPHLSWNQQNNWTTFKFIKNRGIHTEYEGAFKITSDLPVALNPKNFEKKFARNYISEADIKTMDGWVQSQKKEGNLNHSFEFIVAQLFLFGFLAFIVIWATITNFFKTSQERRIEYEKSLQTLFLSSSLVPIIVFGILSFKTEVQTHWAITHTVTSSILLYPLYKRYLSSIIFIAILHLSLFSIISINGDLSTFKTDPRVDRIIQETLGYDKLSKELLSYEKPIFGDRFQTVAQLQNSEAKLKITQYPGVTRPSEFLRRSTFSFYKFNNIKQSNGMVLISVNPVPPHIPSLKPNKVIRYRICDDLNLYSSNDIQFESTICSRPVKKWYVYDYIIANRKNFPI